MLGVNMSPSPDVVLLVGRLNGSLVIFHDWNGTVTLANSRRKLTSFTLFASVTHSGSEDAVAVTACTLGIQLTGAPPCNM